MRNSLPPWCLLAVALAGFAVAQRPEADSSPPLTEEELIRQIDSLGTRAGDPRTKAPASVAAPALPAVKGQGAARASGVRPELAEPPPEKKTKKRQGATEIVAAAVEFDQKTHQAVFTGGVVVKDPEFNVSCDRLTAVLRSEQTPPPPNSAPPKTTPSGEEKPQKGGGLKKAIAQGNVVITQDKMESDGSTTKSTGRSERADYDALTGEVLLSGNPQIQQGINTCIASSPSTTMTLTRDGKMRVDGPSKMVIRDKVDDK